MHLSYIDIQRFALVTEDRWALKPKASVNHHDHSTMITTDVYKEVENDKMDLEDIVDDNIEIDIQYEESKCHLVVP